MLDNPLPLGAGALVVGLLQLRRIRERESRRQEQEKQEGEQEATPAEAWQVECYRSLPLRHLSRAWGAVNEVTLPPALRSPLLGLYARTFGCNLAEASEQDLASYSSLGELFRRRLREGARPVAAEELVSPADGKVLHWGRLAGGDRVEQVTPNSFSKLLHLSPGERCQL